MRSAALVGLAVMALVLTACSSSAQQPPSNSAATPEPGHDAPKTKATKPKLDHPFENHGFTIRYLDQGKIKKIDVPDFEH